MSERESEVVTLLAGSKGLTTHAIGERLGFVDRADVSRLLGNLKKQGLLLKSGQLWKVVKQASAPANDEAVTLEQAPPAAVTEPPWAAALDKLAEQLTAPPFEVADLATKQAVLARLSALLDPSIAAVLDEIALDLLAVQGLEGSPV